MSCAYRHRERCWRDPQTNPFPPRSSFCALRMPISCTGRGRAQTLRRRVPGPLSSRPKPADRRTGVASRSIPPGSPSGCTFRTQKQWEADIEWDEWKNHVAFPHLHPDHLSIFGTQVSGCRLFLVCEVDFYGAPKLDVYDFTIGGELDCSRQCDEKLYGELRTLSYPEERATVPGDEFIEFRSGNGSIVFLTVSVTLSRSPSDRA